MLLTAISGSERQLAPVTAAGEVGYLVLLLLRSDQLIQKGACRLDPLRKDAAQELNSRRISSGVVATVSIYAHLLAVLSEGEWLVGDLEAQIRPICCNK